MREKTERVDELEDEVDFMSEQVDEWLADCGHKLSDEEVTDLRIRLWAR